MVIKNLYTHQQRILLFGSQATPLRYNFNNYHDFAQKIASIVEHETEPIVIACNAIDPLRGESYDFSWIENLPSNKTITLLLDDSHGIGITYTEGGRYFFKNQKKIENQSNITLIVIASLAKSGWYSWWCYFV